MRQQARICAPIGELGLFFAYRVAGEVDGVLGTGTVARGTTDGAAPGAGAAGGRAAGPGNAGTLEGRGTVVAGGPY